MPVGGKQFYPTVCRARPTIDIRHPEKDIATMGAETARQYEIWGKLG